MSVDGSSLILVAAIVLPLIGWILWPALYAGWRWVVG